MAGTFDPVQCAKSASVNVEAYQSTPGLSGGSRLMTCLIGRSFPLIVTTLELGRITIETGTGSTCGTAK